MLIRFFGAVAVAVIFAVCFAEVVHVYVYVHALICRHHTALVR
jgi:hypothetical protein